MRAFPVIALVLTSGVAMAEQAAPPRPNQGAGARAAKADLEDPDIARSPQRPPMAKPPAPVSPEIAKLGKQLAGSYKCKGVTLRGDGSSQPMQATLDVKLDLDNAWIQSSLVEQGKPVSFAIKWSEYRTYDPVAKQWTRIQLANTAGYVVSTSVGEKAGKWMWEGTAASPEGTMQLRDYEQRDAKQTKVWGEAMLGGSWQKLYEATCIR
jgi:hypothetical protein